MLNEEALVVLGTLVACGFLVLGVLDLVWPSQRRPVRRAPPVGVRGRAVETVAAGPLDEPAEELEAEPAAEPATAAIATEDALPGDPPRVVETARVSAAVMDTAPEVADVEPRARAADSSWALERCRQLAAEGRHGEAAAAAMVVLEQPATTDPTVVSALWQEVALARDRMGDRDGALAAYRDALTAAPDADRETVRRELASWAARTARDIVGSAADTERYAALVVARDFLGAAHEIVGAAGAAGAVDAVRADLDVEFWPAYETHVRAVVADRDFSEAYRLATEALSDETLPAEQRSTFEEIRTETLAARVISLVARAVLAIDEGREWEAVGALERADTLVRSGSTLSAERRDETTRQLAGAYGRLGRRRVENGEFEEALDPLLRALRISKAEGEVRDETRWAMVQALQAVVDARTAMIREVAAAGNRDSAVAQADKLWTLLRSGIAAGVPQESLTNAVAATKRLVEEFGGEQGS